jgi:hypothetical protein
MAWPMLEHPTMDVVRRSAPPSSSSDRSAPQPAGRPRVIDLFAHRRWVEDERRDARVNTAWDDLVLLAHEAWNWRDPDVLAELEAHVTALKQEVVADWAEPAQRER